MGHQWNEATWCEKFVLNTLPHPTNTYICGVAITPRVCGGSISLFLLSELSFFSHFSLNVDLLIFLSLTISSKIIDLLSCYEALPWDEIKIWSSWYLLPPFFSALAPICVCVCVCINVFFLIVMGNGSLKNEISV